MARGATLSQLISDLRDELRRLNTSSAAPDDVPSLTRTINHVYATVYAAHDWPHLFREFSRMTLNAGQRHYDFPTGLNPERIIAARLWWGNLPTPIERGITIDDYALYDPEDDDQRATPALKWDIRFTGSTEQIEVWPTPSDSTQKLQFFGITSIDPLVDLTDTCKLDSDLVVLYAAAELLDEKSPDKKAKLDLAKALLNQLKMRGTSGGEKTYQLGLGSGADAGKPYRSMIRVAR